MSIPEYTPLSSQMDRILSTDLIILESPSLLKNVKSETSFINAQTMPQNQTNTAPNEEVIIILAAFTDKL